MFFGAISGHLSSRSRHHTIGGVHALLKNERGCMPQKGENMNQLTYSRVGDYLLPDIRLNEPLPEWVKPLGRYGQLRQKFLREHRLITYSALLLSERLYPHLRDVDETARERRQRGVSEEIILSELVYE